MSPELVIVPEKTMEEGMLLEQKGEEVVWADPLVGVNDELLGLVGVEEEEGPNYL